MPSRIPGSESSADGELATVHVLYRPNHRWLLVKLLMVAVPLGLGVVGLAIPSALLALVGLLISSVAILSMSNVGGWRDRVERHRLVARASAGTSSCPTARRTLVGAEPGGG